MTKMQASEIEQLDNKSFNRWCEVSLPKVYSFYALICLRDFSANAAIGSPSSSNYSSEVVKHE